MLIVSATLLLALFLSDRVSRIAKVPYVGVGSKILFTNLGFVELRESVRILNYTNQHQSHVSTDSLAVHENRNPVGICEHDGLSGCEERLLWRNVLSWIESCPRILTSLHFSLCQAFSNIRDHCPNISKIGFPGGVIAIREQISPINYFDSWRSSNVPNNQVHNYMFFRGKWRVSWSRRRAIKNWWIDHQIRALFGDENASRILKGLLCAGSGLFGCLGLPFREEQRTAHLAQRYLGLTELISKRLPLSISDVSVYRNCNEGKKTYPKVTTLEGKAFILIGVIAAGYFMWKLQFGIDDRGWIWFLCLLLAGGIFIKGLSMAFNSPEELHNGEEDTFPCLAVSSPIKQRSPVRAVQQGHPFVWKVILIDVSDSIMLPHLHGGQFRPSKPSGSFSCRV